MLKDMRKTLIAHIAANDEYLEHNKKTLAVFEGDLLKFVLDILSKTVSGQYLEAIKHRVLPINILQRYVNKVATVYNKPPTRTALDTRYQQHVDFYTEAWELNENGNCADEYSHLFKGYAWEPFYKEEAGK